MLIFERTNAYDLPILTGYDDLNSITTGFPTELFEVTGDLSKRVGLHWDGRQHVPCLQLTDENTWIIQLLIDWAHAALARKGNMRTKNPLNDAISSDLLELYTLAYRYNISRLQYNVMNAMFKACHSKVWWQCSFAHNRSPLARFVERVPEDTQMRQFLVNLLMGSAVAASRHEAKLLTDNIPEQLLRIAFTKIVELPATECPNWKGADENYGVECYIPDDSD